MDILKKLSKKKWHYIHRRVRSPFYMYLIWDACSNRYNPRIPFAYHKIDWIALDQHIAATEDSWEAERKIVRRYLSHSPGTLLKLLKSSYKENKKIEDFCRKLESNNLGSATPKVLLKYWEKYIDLMNKFGAYLLLPLFIEPDMEADLRKIIKKNFPSGNPEEIFQILTTPQILGAAQQDEESILKLAVKMQQGKLTDAAVEKHLREFSWIKNNSFIGSFYTEAELLRRISSVAKKDPAKKLAEFKKRHRDTQKQFLKYYKVIAKKPADKVLLDTLQESIFHRSWRTERYYRNAYFLQSFFAATSKILKLKNPRDIFYLVFPEIIAGLESSPEPQELQELIEERKHGYMVYTEPGLSAVYSGKDLEEAKKMIKIFDTTSAREVHGATAYPGYATGPVIIVKSKHELKKIVPGCILITTSTTVDYVPYLKKVKAIVTDEGGVLSHASVISRELHIPCVIGTKNGTHIFKDGMRVEVDAKNGSVKVL